MHKQQSFVQTKKSDVEYSEYKKALNFDSEMGSPLKFNMEDDSPSQFGSFLNNTEKIEKQNTFKMPKNEIELPAAIFTSTSPKAGPRNAANMLQLKLNFMKKDEESEGSASKALDRARPPPIGRQMTEINTTPRIPRDSFKKLTARRQTIGPDTSSSPMRSDLSSPRSRSPRKSLYDTSVENDGVPRNRSQFMKTLFSDRSGLSPVKADKKHPLDMQSDNSSLKKLGRTGFSVTSHASGAMSSPSGKNGLAHFL